jgi:hypothetical protein
VAPRRAVHAASANPPFGLAPRASLAGILALLACAGCSKSEFDVAPVSGTVMIDGKPFTQGKVMFAPIATGEAREAGRGAFGLLGPDGSFKLTTYDPDDGAVVGEHWVTVIRIAGEGEAAPVDKALAFDRVAVPTKAKVVAGQDNRVDIQLTRQDVARYGMIND